MNGLKLVLLLLGLVVFAQFRDWPLLDEVVIAVTVLLVVAYVWSRLSLRSVAVTRELAADRAQVGGTVAETIRVRNNGRLAKLWLEARDYSTLPGHAASRALHVPGQGAVAWRVETPCTRRGRFRVGPLVLRSGDPFGLFPVAVSAPVGHEVVVYPATLDASGFPLPGGTLRGGYVARRPSPAVTPNVAGVRDYAPGDPFNRISWGATARMGRMMVKEFDVDPTADVWLVLDLDQRHHVAATRPLDVAPDANGRWPVAAWLDSTEEFAVTIAASLARRGLDEGRAVGLIATGAHYEVIPPDRSDRQGLKILEALAVLHADGLRPLGEVLMAEMGRFDRHSSVVVITPSTEEAWAGSLVEVVDRRAAAAAVIVEPETFAPADSALLVVSRLVAASIPTHLVKYGSDIAASLAGPQVGAAGGGRRG